MAHLWEACPFSSAVNTASEGVVEKDGEKKKKEKNRTDSWDYKWVLKVELYGRGLF